MSNLIGSWVKDSNSIFRLLAIAAMGVFAVGAILYWRMQLFASAEYQDLPVSHQEITIINQNNLIKKELYGDN